SDTYTLPRPMYTCQASMSLRSQARYSARVEGVSLSKRWTEGGLFGMLCTHSPGRRCHGSRRWTPIRSRLVLAGELVPVRVSSLASKSALIRLAQLPRIDESRPKVDGNLPGQ